MDKAYEKSIPFQTDQVFIAGQWRGCASGQTLPLLDPSDGAPLADIARGGADDIDAAVLVFRPVNNWH